VTTNAEATREERRGDNTRDFRTPTQRDRDRVLYSPEFRRLASVTQVVSTSELQLFHNRLTHSLKVAQLARRLAERIKNQPDRYPPDVVAQWGGIDEDAAETAALAHDLGHPPFGHIAETEIQAWLKQEGGPPDSFEGNAQTFRIVTKLSFRRKHPIAPALDLTRVSLNAILKYPWKHGHRPDTPLAARYPDKWGGYLCDAAYFDWVREGHTNGKTDPRRGGHGLGR